MREYTNSEDAVSEVVGYLVLLSIIMVSVGIVTLLIYPIVQDSKEEAYLKNMEQGFTVLDSKISMVALGKSPSQVVQVYTQSGDIAINNNNASWITVTLMEGDNTYMVYNESLGTIEYRLRENTIAYEGGGVFRKYPGDGDPVMITPPEFHYNGETLTLPIIRVNSNQSIGGTGVISLYFNYNNTPNVLYPNSSQNEEYVNPLEFGKQVVLFIKSEYYKAWANYIQERTDATVSIDKHAHEVKVVLNSKPTNSARDLNPPIDVFGFDVTNDSALQNFSMVLADGSSNFKLKMTTSPTYSEPYFTFSAEKSGGEGTAGVTIILEYSDNGKKESWKWDVQALKVEDDFNVDFLNNSAEITYKSPSSEPSWTWDDETFPYNRTYNNGDLFPGGGRKIFQHYMTLVGPTFTFHGASSPYYSGFDPDSSSYILYYDVMPPRITYLHIVEHKIQSNVR